MKLKLKMALLVTVATVAFFFNFQSVYYFLLTSRKILSPQIIDQINKNILLDPLPQNKIPVINIFYSQRSFGKTERLESVKGKNERSNTNICPLFQKIAMAQARQWNEKVYFVEEGEACKEWMESHNIFHIQLPEEMVFERFTTLHQKFPDLKDMNAEFTYAYARQWDYLYVANLLGASSFCFIDGDVMTYTSALTLASHMEKHGFGAAYCLYWPRANNLFGYFTVAALNDMIRYLDYFPNGHSPWGAGDMGWLKNYAGLSFTDEEVGFRVRRPANFTPQFKIGDTCSYWEGGVGADVISLDQDWEGEFMLRTKTYKQIVWINKKPFFIRNNDSAAIPVWHMHFQGQKKVMMQNYLRWSRVAGDCYELKEQKSKPFEHCECFTNHCKECYTKSKCDFSKPVNVDKQAQSY